MTFSAHELIRYSRHLSLPHVGEAGQTKLKHARVLCIGAGGLGCPVLTYLAAAGVGTLGIIDHDGIEESNLQRQVLYHANDLGKYKALVAKQRCLAMNPHIHIDTMLQKLTKENARDIIRQYDIVVDATDNFPTRYIINDACFYEKKPLVFASIFQFEGQCTVLGTPHGPCYRCWYPTPPPAGLMPNCSEGGVLGILPGLLGMIQATEVIKWILSIGDLLVGRILTVNALTMSFKTFELKRHLDCALCRKQTPYEALPTYESRCELSEDTSIPSISVYALKDHLKENDVNLIDVREAYERDICNIGGDHIPLGELPFRLDEIKKDKPLVMYCKLGGRSQRAVHFLQAAGFKNVLNLSGGIMAWAKEVDGSLKVY